MTRGKRAATVVVFLLVGGILYLYLDGRVKETEIAFVLTDLEVPSPVRALRYEDVERLECHVVDEATGKTLATIVHRKPGAVSNPTSVRLRPGMYALHLTLTLRLPDGTPREVSSVVRQALDGGHVDVRP